MSSVGWILGGVKAHGDPKHHHLTRDLLCTVGAAVALHGSSTLVELQPPPAAGSDGLLTLTLSTSNGKNSCSTPARREFLDLNFPPVPAASSLAVFTLEFVNSALERAERDRQSKQQSSSSSTITSSLKRRAVVEEGPELLSAGGDEEMVLAKCRNCFLYVVVVKSEPMCPKCELHVPVPAIWKRPRIFID